MINLSPAILTSIFDISLKDQFVHLRQSIRFRYYVSGS